MFAVLLLAAAAHSPPITDAQRIAAKIAIERARYAFVIGNKPPFETQYPHSFFETQLRQEREGEAVLKRVYAVVVTRSDLAYEYERIEKSTRAPDQWEAVKAAVHHNRRLVEEVVCRPILVDRALRVKFAFDQRIHAEPHQEARHARAEFLAGRKPAGAVELTLSRKPEDVPTEKMLEDAKTLKPGEPPKASAPILLEPEALAVLEKELHRPGEISTILEYRDRFEVYRLLEAQPATWRVEAVRFSKEDFDAWYASVGQRHR